MNIVLVGMMGSGKSAVGQILARRLGRPFVDTDAEVAAAAGMGIPALFARSGEDGFRALEQETVTRVAARTGQVIATGGGAVLAPANREALRRNGLVFWLQAAPGELYRRALAQGIAGRPLLAGPDPLGRLEGLAVARDEAYRLASHHVLATDGLTPDAVAAQVLRLWKEEPAHGNGRG